MRDPYRLAPVDSAALAFLWNHLWARGREECARLGCSLALGFDALANFVGRGDAVMLYAALRPVFVLGAMPEGAGYVTFFAATDEFEQHASTITRVLRRFARDYFRAPLYIYSVLVHPQAERWFRALGFERDGWCGRTPAGYPLYRFVRS